VITPEAVPLHLDTATAGSRLLAGTIDAIVIMVVLLVAALALGLFNSLSGTGAWVLGSLAVLFSIFGYFAVLEMLWDGRTVGKRALGLRVVTTEGAPASATAVLTRNLVRIVDMLPGLPLVGTVAILATAADQRLGDLAAGTLVVRDAAAPAPAAPAPRMPPPAWTETLDLGALTEADRQLLRSYLSRRGELTAQARTRLSRSVAGRLRARVHGLPGVDDDDLIDGIARRLRSL